MRFVVVGLFAFVAASMSFSGCSCGVAPAGEGEGEVAEGEGEGAPGEGEGSPGEGEGEGTGEGEGEGEGSGEGEGEGGSTCGDGALDGGEACDGTAFANNATCADFGFGRGVLACALDCTIDQSGCFNDTAPVINGITADTQTITAPDVDAVITVDASDADGDPLTITFTQTGAGSPTAGLTIVANGTQATVTADPTQVPAGNYTIHVVVDDGFGGSVAQDFVVTVGNHAPTIAAGNAQATLPTSPAATLTFTAAVTDVDQASGDVDTVTWSAVSTLPAGVSLVDNGDGTATFSVDRAVYQQPLTQLDVAFTLQASVVDSAGASATSTTTATVIDERGGHVLAGSGFHGTSSSGAGRCGNILHPCDNVEDAAANVREQRLQALGPAFSVEVAGSATHYPVPHTFVDDDALPLLCGFDATQIDAQTGDWAQAGLTTSIDLDATPGFSADATAGTVTVTGCDLTAVNTGIVVNRMNLVLTDDIVDVTGGNVFAVVMGGGGDVTIESSSISATGDATFALDATQAGAIVIGATDLVATSSSNSDAQTLFVTEATSTTTTGVTITATAESGNAAGATIVNGSYAGNGAITVSTAGRAIGLLLEAGVTSAQHTGAVTVTGQGGDVDGVLTNAATALVGAPVTVTGNANVFGVHAVGSGGGTTTFAVSTDATSTVTMNASASSPVASAVLVEAPVAFTASGTDIVANGDNGVGISVDDNASATLDDVAITTGGDVAFDVLNAGTLSIDASDVVVTCSTTANVACTGGLAESGSTFTFTSSLLHLVTPQGAAAGLVVGSTNAPGAHATLASATVQIDAAKGAVAGVAVTATDPTVTTTISASTITTGGTTVGNSVALGLDGSADVTGTTIAAGAGPANVDGVLIGERSQSTITLANDDVSAGIGTTSSVALAIDPQNGGANSVVDVTDGSYVASGSATTLASAAVQVAGPVHNDVSISGTTAPITLTSGQAQVTAGLLVNDAGSVLLSVANVTAGLSNSAAAEAETAGARILGCDHCRVERSTLLAGPSSNIVQSIGVHVDALDSSDHVDVVNNSITGGNSANASGVRLDGDGGTQVRVLHNVINAGGVEAGSGTKRNLVLMGQRVIQTAGVHNVGIVAGNIMNIGGVSVSNSGTIGFFETCINLNAAQSSTAQATRAVDNDFFPSPKVFLRHAPVNAGNIGCAAVTQDNFATMTGRSPYNDVNTAGCSSHSLNVDPQLGSDGVTLAATSPMIDAAPSTFGCGNDTFWNPAVTADGPLTDFFGTERPLGVSADIGADELR